MSHGYRLLAFYGCLLVVLSDIYAVASRFMKSAVDPVSWDKTFFAVLLQGIAIAGALAYVYWLSATKRSLLEPGARFWSPGFRIAPLIGACLLAAFSHQMLYNAWNCGSHPLPTNRGIPTCPR